MPLVAAFSADGTACRELANWTGRPNHLRATGTMWSISCSGGSKQPQPAQRYCWLNATVFLRALAGGVIAAGGSLRSGGGLEVRCW